MEKPRKVYAISTEYFDILFPAECLQLATLLGSYADNLYKQASSEFENASIKSRRNKRFPVIISPDSDNFSVTYTPSPYNRIIIQQAVPQIQDAAFTDIILSRFYGEIVRAVYQSITGPLETKLTKYIKTDSFQPVYLENMPFSFLEGIQFLKESEDLEIFEDIQEDECDEYIEEYYDEYEEDYFEYPLQGKINDGYSLQILSQAKLENKFPSFIQTLGARDIYPGTEIIQAAGSGFCAYILQRWGLEKFQLMWVASGSFTLHLTEGIFLSVYDYEISKAWEDFKDSIPLPEDLETLQYLETQSEELLPYENKGLYKNLVDTPYGIVWYDDLKHEVSLHNKDSLFIGRQLLFIADNVKHISLSPNKRFLMISFMKNNLRNDIQKNCCWIYDLKNRTIIIEKLNLRDATIINLPDGTIGIAGIADKTTHATIQIYSSAKINNLLFRKDNFETCLLYEKEFNQETIPFTPAYIDDEKLYYINYSYNQFSLCIWDFVNDKNYSYSIPDNMKIRNLNVTHNPYNNSENKSSILTFEYVNQEIENKQNFTRYGFIFLNHDGFPKQTWLLTNNLSGGTTYPIIKDDNLYYAAKKFDHGEIRKISLHYLDFSLLELEENTTSDFFFSKNIEISDLKELAKHEFDSYKQITDVFKGSIDLFQPVREISVVDKIKKAPGLGVTFSALADKYSNNYIALSAGAGFLDLHFEKITNPTDRILAEIERRKLDTSRDYSAAAFYQNTSTPFDISAGTIFKTTLAGDYEFKILTGAVYTMPLGMSIRKLNFELEGHYTFSTRFRDLIYADYYPSLENKTSLGNSYQDITISFALNYTNIHQSGFSPYEQRGLSASFIPTIIWDINLPPLAKEAGNELFGAHTFAKNTFFNPSQIYLGFSGSAKIPQLTFAKDYNDFIICLPTSIDLDLFKENGTALDVKTEILVFGKEIQNGFNILHLYFSRIGFKVGYDFSLVYDTDTISPPDFRDFSRFYKVFVNTETEDYLSFKTELDFIPAIGILSSGLLHTSIAFDYYLRTNTTKFTFNVDMKL